MDRRQFLIAGAAASLAGTAAAQTAPALREAPPSAEPYAALRGGAPHHLSGEEEAQRQTESPAPAGPPGRWAGRAALPIPRSEMAWATAWADRLHVVGGYGEGRVDRAYHHVYDPGQDRWFDAAPLPRGANHVAVVADAGRLYALGGSSSRTATPTRTPSSTTSRRTAGARSRR